MVSSALVIFSLFTAAQALNDWSKPCLSGVCSYDIPESTGSSSGSLKIWGSQDAISDITTAAGWEIIGCSPDAIKQDIRLVCKDENPDDSACSHLYKSTGAVGKIVRLPEACGKNAFARISRAWVPEDQSIPASIAGKIVRRDGSQPEVKALALDTNFEAVDTSKTGPVNFALQGANVKGAAGEIDTSSVAPERRSRIHGNVYDERGLFDFVGKAINAIKNLNNFGVDKSKVLTPLSLNKKFNLLDQKLSCPPITAAMKIDVDAKANAAASIGVAASGTIIPPKVKDFAIITSLDADIDGTLTMIATASGALDSGKQKIFEVGVPGLDFPGILTVGPTFAVNAQATAQLDIKADLTVGLNYHVKKAQLIFPPNSQKAQQAGGSFTVGDTPLKLSVAPNVKATGSVAAHFIPSVNLKVSALGDIVKAGVFLEMDASAEMNLSLEGTVQGSITVDKGKREEPAVKGRYWAPAELEERQADDSARRRPKHRKPNRKPHRKPTHVKPKPPVMAHPVPVTSSAHPPVATPTPVEDSETCDAPKTITVTVTADDHMPETTSTTADAKPTTHLDTTTVKETHTPEASSTSEEVHTTSSAHETQPTSSAHETQPTSSAHETQPTSSAHETQPTSSAHEIPSDTPAPAESTKAASTSSADTPKATLPVNSGNNLTVVKDGSASFGGCFKVNAGINVNAGADANFFGLFNPSTKVSLFNRKFEILKKCFGNAKRSLPLPSSSLTSGVFQKRALTCAPAAAGNAEPVSVADQIVQAGTIVAV